MEKVETISIFYKGWKLTWILFKNPQASPILNTPLIFLKNTSFKKTRILSENIIIWQYILANSIHFVQLIKKSTLKAQKKKNRFYGFITRYTFHNLN